uniref:Uncharacterized protein n=1 Tax=Leersia perrieri TaxID=77586 RepID=A0A0D9W4H4_9ORYZ
MTQTPPTPHPNPPHISFLQIAGASGPDSKSFTFGSISQQRQVRTPKTPLLVDSLHRSIANAIRPRLRKSDRSTPRDLSVATQLASGRRRLAPSSPPPTGRERVTW